MSCGACKAVRQLDPSRVPASCEQCGKTEFDENNNEAWALFDEFPGLIVSGMNGWQVNYNAFFKITERLYFTRDEQLPMLRKFEAIRKGLSERKKR